MTKRWLILILALVGFSFVSVAAWRSYKMMANARTTAETMRISRDQAERGDAKAEDELGSMYFYGVGVSQDYAAALQWYRRSADKGFARAKHDVGYMYDTGKGVQQDFAQAIYWYRQAADQGDPQAECGLAAMYYSGRGVTPDRAQAAQWYRRSAEQGLARAQYDLGYMYYYGQGVTEDRKQARIWIRRAAERGDENARQFLGMRLTPWLIVILAIQAIAGIALAFRPVSLNIWEPSEGMQNRREWLSIAAGTLFLFNAGLSWYGYTHNLIWCWVYGCTGFQLLKWGLNLIALVLVSLVLIQGTERTRKPSTVA